MSSTPPIAILGAGSIGSYVGGRLAAAGADVTLIGRARLAPEIAAHGLHLSDWRGAAFAVPANAVRVDTTPATLSSSSLIVVTVKSADTATAAASIAAHARPGAIVLSLQNGLDNDAVLRAALPKQRVVAGMVPFNVVHRGDGRFHQSSEGALDAARDTALAPWLAAFAAAGLALTLHDDMDAVRRAKLVLNLNNAVNALSGLPLAAQLAQRNFRRSTALAQAEALRVFAAARLPVARLTALPPAWLPHVLRLPDAVFRRVASRLLAIDPLARSSMQDDLDAGRVTEVDWLNGAVVGLGATWRVPTPVNAALAAMVHAAERGGERHWEGSALFATLRRAAA